jgi:hypothetical protein
VKLGGGAPTGSIAVSLAPADSVEIGRSGIIGGNGQAVPNISAETGNARQGTAFVDSGDRIECGWHARGLGFEPPMRRAETE